MRQKMAKTTKIGQVHPELVEYAPLHAKKSDHEAESGTPTIGTEGYSPEGKEAWLSRLRERAITRTGHKKQTDSAILIRKARQLSP
jgi:hypothetical protein